MSLIIRFKAWRRFSAQLDEKTLTGFLRTVARNSERAFKKGMQSRKNGKWYRGKSGRNIRASAPNTEYPAIDTGDLQRSIGTRTTDRETTIGTNMFYSKFLREGTSKMARRRMSDDALKEGISTSRHKLEGFVRWKRR